MYWYGLALLVTWVAIAVFPATHQDQEVQTSIYIDHVR